jgi:hypothetical protein
MNTSHAAMLNSHLAIMSSMMAMSMRGTSTGSGA